jgi:hypothetical protein
MIQWSSRRPRGEDILGNLAPKGQKAQGKSC